VSWQRILYRVGQVIRGLRPRLTESDRAEVARWLTPEQMALWERQSPRDQAHALRVLRTLQAWGWTDASLMRAALLHDVGKVEGSPSLIHRSLWVLARKMSSRRAKSWLVRPRGWRRPFWVLAEHPRLGARLARSVGVDDSAIWLIEHHQDEHVDGPASLRTWWAALREADDQN